MVKLYVEGGGDSTALKTACREGFSTFLEKAGFKGKMPRIVACGSRRDAYDSFKTSIDRGENAILLVDSETPVKEQYQSGDENEWHPWLHLAERNGDKWEKPVNATDEQCHLMVLCMESWFIADKSTLERFFGQGFKESVLPSDGNQIEKINKENLYSVLTEATKHCKTKAKYGKGEHSFKILKEISPEIVKCKCPWANRFISLCKEMMG